MKIKKNILSALINTTPYLNRALQMKLDLNPVACSCHVLMIDPVEYFELFQINQPLSSVKDDPL